MKAQVQPTCAVGAIVMNEGSILLVKRDREPARGQWSLPGGRVNSGESLSEALVREVKEETGVDVSVDSMIGLAERILRDDDGDLQFHFVIVDFVATLQGSPELHPGDDAADARWVRVDELGDLSVTAGLVEFLSDRGIIARGKARIAR